MAGAQVPHSSASAYQSLSLTGLLQTISGSAEDMPSPRPSTEPNFTSPDRRPISIRVETEVSGENPSSHVDTIVIPRSFLRHLRRPAAANQDHTAAVGGDAEESTASAAERHRLAQSNVLDLQALATWFEQLMPYLLLVSGVFLYYHSEGIFIFSWLLWAILRTNQNMRRQIAHKQEIKAIDVLRNVLYISANAFGVLYFTASDGVWRQFLLLPPRAPLTVWQALFLVMVVDSLVRLLGCVPKMLVVLVLQCTCAPSPRTFRQQSQLLTLLEYLILSYRNLLPTIVWYKYFLACATSQVFVCLTTGFYLTFKSASIYSKLNLTLNAVQMFFRQGAMYGAYASKEEIAEAGAVCAICQDNMQTAVKLPCNHMFCEDCLAEWLERDRTCPMCRADVKPPGLQSFSDGTTPLLPQLF